MDADLRTALFDPGTVRHLVLAHRPQPERPVGSVVSDVVWNDVVRLLRWAAAHAHGDPDVQAGAWWRLAAGCADLLRRLPRLSDEIEEDWLSVDAPDLPGEAAALQRLRGATERLGALLRTPGPVPLRVLGRSIDALGAAAVGALAEDALRRRGRPGTAAGW